MLFTWGILAGLIFLFAPKGLTGRLQLTYAQVFRWPLTVGRGLTVVSQAAPHTQNVSRKDYEELSQENRRLKNDFANARAQLDEAHAKIEQLAGLRMKSQWENMQFLPADVVAVADQAQNELLISRGQDDKVAVGQYVMSLSDHSIIGTISEVSAKGSKVRLITYPGARMPVTIADPNVRGIMEGRGNGAAGIPLIPAQHRIRVGDHVYAQKKAGLLDVPVIAAQVTQCRRDANNPLLWDITVQPVCKVGSLTEIIVVISTVRPR